MRESNVRASGFAVIAIGAVVGLASSGVATLLAREPDPFPVEKPIVYPPLEPPAGYVYTARDFRRCEWWGPPRDCLDHVHRHISHDVENYVDAVTGKPITTAPMEVAPACSVLTDQNGEIYGDANASIVELAPMPSGCRQYPWTTH